MRTALLVIDVQQALCEGEYAMFDAAGVIARINAVSSQARAQGLPVIFVQHDEPEPPLLLDSPGWQLATGMDVQPGDTRVRKTTPDAFNATDLQAQLAQRGIERLIVCGMQSEYCVDTTVRRALALKYHVVLLADAHTSMDNEAITARQIIAHHNVTFRHMSSFGPRIKVLPVAQLQL